MNKFLYNITLYLYSFIYYTFWVYFALIIILYLLDVKINSILSYIFFFLFGIFISSRLMKWAFEYMRIYKNDNIRKS